MTTLRRRFQHEVVEHRRQRSEGHGAGVEEPFDLGIAAGQGVADDHEVGRQAFQSGRVVARMQRDARVRQDGAHRRVDAGIGAQHVMPSRAREQRRVAHRCPAEAHEVNPHFAP